MGSRASADCTVENVPNKSQKKTETELSSKSILVHGMKPYNNKWVDYYGDTGMAAEGRTTIDILNTCIQCDNIQHKIEHYIHSFWDQHRKNKTPNNPDIKNILNFEYDPNIIICSETEQFYGRTKWFTSYNILLNVNFVNQDINKYHSTIDIVSKLLTGQRNKELDVLLSGYLREYNVPSVINELCVKYFGIVDKKHNLFIKPLQLKWGKDIKNTSNQIRKLLISVIEKEDKNIQHTGICWKCILVRGIFDRGIMAGDDSWYLWWFTNKKQNKSDCILMQFKYSFQW